MTTATASLLKKSSGDLSILEYTMPELQEVHDAPSVAVISVTLIGPDEPRRKAIASALAKCPGVRVQEISSYPADVEAIPQMLEEHHDVVIVALDGDPELALN